MKPRMKSKTKTPYRNRKHGPSCHGAWDDNLGPMIDRFEQWSPSDLRLEIERLERKKRGLEGVTEREFYSLAAMYAAVVAKKGTYGTGEIKHG